MLYRKKAIIVDAVIWNGNVISETKDWVNEALHKDPGTPGNIFRMGNEVKIYTLEGEMTASPGDYIIKGVQGELYPCKPDIFAATYDHITTPANFIVSEAVTVLIECLKADEELRRAYQANIAVAFQDEWQRSLPGSNHSPMLINRIANRAANRFLESLCNTTFNTLD